MRNTGRRLRARDMTAQWIKSSYSGPTGGNCVEVAFLERNGVAVRNSRRPDSQPLVFTQAEWDAFIRGARDGEFDAPS